MNTGVAPIVLPASTVRSITDGTALTIGVVEANRSVPWTKPEDIPYEPSGALPNLGGHFDGGFNSMFMDGSAHFVPTDLEEPVLRALLSKGGREVIDRDQKTNRFKVGF